MSPSLGAGLGASKMLKSIAAQGISPAGDEIWLCPKCGTPMDSYMSTQYTSAREPVKRVRRVCKPCMATHKKIHRLRKEERWDELERAIEAGKHSRAARIRANSGQGHGNAEAA